MRILNVGGGHKGIPLPPQFAEFEQVLLDIDPRGQPDIVCDARKLDTLEPNQFDAVYCSHNLEHYYRHEVPNVLRGFLHVLKDGGFAYIVVPDMAQVLHATVARKLDLEDTLYESAAGPITVLDVIYGYGKEIEMSGQDFYAHKTGFTPKSLISLIERVGFSITYNAANNLDLKSIAFKGRPADRHRALFNLPPPPT